MPMEKHDWEQFYQKYSRNELPWESVKVDLKTKNKLEEITKKINSSKKTALDIGSGAGTYSVLLSMLGYDTLGVEISQTAIETAIKYASEVQLNSKETPKFKLIDFENYKTTKKFDLIFDRGYFHHVKPNKRNDYILQIKKLLKEDGFFILICFSSKHKESYNHFSSKQIVDLYEPYFEIISLEDITHTQPKGTKIDKLMCVLKNK